MFDYLLDQSRFMSLFGIATILGVAFIFSKSRRKINIRQVASALGLQFIFAFLILKTDLGRAVFESLSHGFSQLYQFASAGTDFVFGKLADVSGPWAFVFVIKVIPIIIFFGALMSVLFYLGVIQLAVKGVAIVIRPILGTSGAETLCAVANSMLGQTEAPLLIKNYLPHLTESEMLVVMIGGMAHLSGSILAVYGSLGVPILHLLAASVMAIPGAILVSKILLPETDEPITMGKNQIEVKKSSSNLLDAIASGTSDGMFLAVNVVAMLISFISIIALVNYVLVSLGLWSLNELFSHIFAPFARLLSIAPEESAAAGMLIGTKLVVNEFVAYIGMVKESLSERTVAILTYALAGFANFSSIGIQIGGIGSLSPEKRGLLTRLGYKALLGGMLTNLLTAAVASLFI